MNQGVFINYRRSDSKAIAGRIDDYLRDSFGNSNVFRDLESIPIGLDFGDYIRNELGECDVFLAVIGHSWDTARLGEEQDLVRIEIEEALKLQLLIVPVLVEGAPMPEPSLLPESIQSLTRANAIAIDSGPGFREQVHKLIAGIRDFRKSQGPRGDSTEERLRNDAMLKYDALMKSQDDSGKRRMQELATRANLQTLQQAMPEIEHSVRKIKSSLGTLGFYAGQVDDAYSPDFFDAVAAFQQSAGLRPVDGIFGRDTFIAMMRQLFPEQFNPD